jgi:NAD(P)-dependent dehydrogenase (short-subunit alcohol dehydrogenase family)
MGRLDGKTALVAGAGGGIGGAGAVLLAREGAAVMCGDVDAAAAEACAAAIRSAGGKASALALDVASQASIDAAVARTVAELGGIDVLLDSAGVSTTASVLDLTREAWDRVLAVNLTGMFLLGQAVARQMVAQARGGSIVNVTSQLAEVGIQQKTAYLASKGGARSLTIGMALDLAPHGIRVNAVAPGPTLTGLTRDRFADDDVRAWTLSRIPLGRIGEPADLAGAIVFLASDEARWVTGTTIAVDGGYLAE